LRQSLSTSAMPKEPIMLPSAYSTRSALEPRSGRWHHSCRQSRQSVGFIVVIPWTVMSANPSRDTLSRELSRSERLLMALNSAQWPCS
jgi:hypothetical protein